MFLLGPALGADPILWEVRKGRAGLDAVVKVALGRIINISAGAFILMHFLFSFV
jgi:hypothetical protein